MKAQKREPDIQLAPSYVLLRNLSIYVSIKTTAPLGLSGSDPPYFSHVSELLKHSDKDQVWNICRIAVIKFLSK